MFSEFKNFISKGNVIDLAVGVIIGSAFGSIVTSLVNDIFMPVLGLIIGKVNFTGLKFVIVPADGEKAEVAVLYGSFIQNVINFLIMAFVIFLMVKAISNLKKEKKEETEEKKEEPKISAEEKLLTEIRDILKENKYTEETTNDQARK